MVNKELINKIVNDAVSISLKKKKSNPDISTLIEINKDEYFKHYCEIRETCYESNYPLPKILLSITVPEKYDLKKELKNSSKTLADITEYENNLNQIESEYDNIVFEGNLDEYLDKLIVAWNSELLSWVSKFPEFNKIL